MRGWVRAGRANAKRGHSHRHPSTHCSCCRSWGAGWGESGYFRLAVDSKDERGACGVLQAASFPLKKTSTNPEVPTFCGFLGWTECPVHTACTCNVDLFGLLCLNWGCQKA